ESGSICVNGKDISDYALADYRKQFVVVSQNSMIFSGTVRENLSYGNSSQDEQRMYDALRLAGAYDFVMAMEGGLDAEIAEYGSNLSGGQKQRLAMARALMSDAHYLILDEPVAAMDAIATRELLDGLQNVVKDRCAIIISHTDAILSLANRAVVVENGVLAAEGPIEEVAEKNAFLRTLMGKEAAV
ncbi:MAG: ATP-binding cassette domain-containing protein, partial [Clostridia bacterium]|nr:ATP-binding cassette domain-containing protein [Clostridia bacterium]